MPYLDWNQRVFERVFNADRKDRMTTVYVDEDIIHEWATEMGLGTINSADSVKSYVQDCLLELGGDPANIADYCDYKAIAWGNCGLKGVPCFMGMLGLLVLASGWGDGSGHLYYGRYWGLTGSDRTGMIPGIANLKKIWRQLETFSSRNRYELGIYKVRTLAPAKVNVGVIVAQGVLRREDEKSLKDIFYDEGADANVEYTDQHIRSWLDKHRGRLSARAQRALDSVDNADYLIGRVREELEEWDGEPADNSNLMGRSRSFIRSVHLCLNRRFDGCPYAEVRLDFSGRSGDPEAVIFVPDGSRYSAYSNGDAISTPLERVSLVNVDSVGPKPAAEVLRLTSPADFQKFIGGEFNSEVPGNSYRYFVRTGAIRVFVDGAALGVGGYVEAFGLKPGFRHIVFLKDAETSDEIKSWCQLHADDQVNVRSIVPGYFSDNPLWKVFAIRANVPPCEAPQARELKYEVRPLARFAGGLKLYRRGNKYLATEPPVVNIFSRHAVSCRINDGPEFNVDGFVLSLDGLLPLGVSKLLIKEQIEGGLESELNLILMEDAEWSREGAGAVHSLTEVPPGPVDDFKAVVGCWMGAYSEDAGDLQEMKASWQYVDGGSFIPCVSINTLAERVKQMAGVRHRASFEPGKLDAWRKVLSAGRPHPAFASTSVKMVWDNFTRKSR